MSIDFQPRVWLNFVLPVLRPLEQAIIDAWVNQLDNDIRLIIRRQLQHVNYVQRHDGGRDVCLYWIRYGLFNTDFPDLLPSSAREFKLATMKFRVANGRPFEVEFWAANGQFFSLDFDRSPRKFVNCKTIEILELDLHPVQETGPNISQLPADYLDILKSDFEQRRFTEAQILPVAEIIPLKFTEGKFYALAVVGDLGMLAVSASAEDKQVYFLDYDGGAPRPLSTSFRAALHTAIAEHAKTLR